VGFQISALFLCSVRSRNRRRQSVGPYSSAVTGNRENFMEQFSKEGKYIGSLSPLCIYIGFKLNPKQPRALILQCLHLYHDINSYIIPILQMAGAGPSSATLDLDQEYKGILTQLQTQPRQCFVSLFIFTDATERVHV